MNVDYLRLFVRIAALNNISLAGKELGLSPAVSSTHINKLEESLGVRLVHRTTRRVALTEEGIDFLPHAEEVLASVEAAEASVGSGSVKPKGTLRITVPASFGRMHIVPALSGFLSCYPDLRVNLHMSDLISDIVEGGFDVAIRNSSLRDSTLIARKLASDTRIICAAPSYLERYGEPKTPADLENHRCIGLTGIEEWTFKTAKGVQKARSHNVLRIDNGEAIRDACINGMGITINSVWCAYKGLGNGELVQVLKDYPLVTNTAIWIVYPSSRLLAPKVRVLIDYLIEYFGDIPYWENY